MKVCVHLANGFEEIEAITVIDVLRRAKISVDVISVTGKLDVVGAHNIIVYCDELINNIDYDNCDMIVLPGGMPGTLNLQNHQGLIKVIRDFNDNKKWIAAICAAPKILGNMGILNGIEATCYPGFEEELEGAIISKQSVVQQDHIITSRGPGTALEFSLKLVELLLDKVTAVDLKEKMIII